MIKPLDQGNLEAKLMLRATCLFCNNVEGLVHVKLTARRILRSNTSKLTECYYKIMEFISSSVTASQKINASDVRAD